MPENLNPEAVEAASNSVRRITLGEVDSWDVASAAVSAYFAALPSPRPGTLIKTEEELGQLHESTYVEDMYGDRGVVFNEHIWYPETKPLLLNYALKHYGPFTVLWMPTEGGRQ